MSAGESGLWVFAVPAFVCGALILYLDAPEDTKH